MFLLYCFFNCWQGVCLWIESNLNGMTNCSDLMSLPEFLPPKLSEDATYFNDISTSGFPTKNTFSGYFVPNLTAPRKVSYTLEESAIVRGN